LQIAIISVWLVCSRLRASTNLSTTLILFSTCELLSRDSFLFYSLSAWFKADNAFS